MNKQIEELMKEIHLNCPCGLFEDEAESIAKFVIEKQGYRKQSETARDIFDSIERHSKHLRKYQYCNYLLTSLFIILDEIKKIYGVTEE